MRRGIATFTLDTGRCPKWLFERMVRLGREMVGILVDEYGSDEFIRRISDPVWFQSLGTVLAFDWNSSGLTTILTAALKEAIRGEEEDLGIFICGGKGKASRKTPEEIILKAERADLTRSYAENLVYNSRMAAKIDSALVQDGFQIYHHSFFFSRNGVWTVVQQGMNPIEGTARRYHWFSENVRDLIEEPHSGIVSEISPPHVLDLTSRASAETRKISIEFVQAGFRTIAKDIEVLRRHSSDLSRMISLRTAWAPRPPEQLTLLKLEDKEFYYHPVVEENFFESKYLKKIIEKLTYEKPENYEKLLATEGVGPKTIRALSLVSEVIYGAKPSYEDPARYSFAHGGKDATPYPVDRLTYDKTIETLKVAIRKSRFSEEEKDHAIRRLENSGLVLRKGSLV